MVQFLWWHRILLLGIVRASEVKNLTFTRYRKINSYRRIKCNDISNNSNYHFDDILWMLFYKDDKSKEKEEDFLIATFGDEYLNYRKEVNRYLGRKKLNYVESGENNV